MIDYMALPPGYLPPAPAIGGIIPGALPPPLPLPPGLAPLPTPIPGTAKSGFAALASSITSSCLIGLRPYGPYCPGNGGPPAPGGGGLQFGLTPRWETEVKCETSDAAGERDPSFRSSYDERRREGSETLREGTTRLGFELKPPGMREAGSWFGGGARLPCGAGSAKRGSTSS